MADACGKCDRTGTSSPLASHSDKLQARNLVVCIDGTANQFGERNTNVIELYSQLVSDDAQLTYYNSGIGTFAGQRRLSFWMRAGFSWLLELMTAKNISKIVRGAYRWLAENYQNGDRIYLFGFSRGAYAVRILAAMIEKVGLIRKGNEEQIPFAYAIYKDPNTDLDPNTKASRTVFRNKNTKKDKKSTSARVFKDTFSRNVPVHFVGVWDTVSSIGIARRDLYPGTTNPHTACYFRHALALDERRVKFLPEYARGGKMLDSEADPPDERVKEVWFNGTHSDIGGGNVPNLSLNNGPAPLVWMLSAAYKAGIRIHFKNLGKWSNFGTVNESLKSYWRVPEHLPIKHLSYADKDSTTRRCHRGRGRLLQDGQHIHVSVALCPRDKLPRAILPANSGLSWEDFVTTSPLQDAWKDVIEIDSFAVKVLAQKIRQDQPGQDLQSSLQLLAVMTSFESGIDRLKEDPPAVLALYRRMKQGYEGRDDNHDNHDNRDNHDNSDNMVHDGQDIIGKALERIGKVKASALNRTELMSEMEESISSWKGSSWGFQMIVIFLHEHNLMLPPFAKLMCEEFLSWAWECLGRTTDYDCKTRSLAIDLLTIASQDGDLPLRSEIARKIGSILINLLEDSINWGEYFDAVYGLLEELTSHVESHLIVFGDVPLLLQAFQDLVSSGGEVKPAVVCQHFITILGGLFASEEGRIAFLNGDPFELLVELLARGTTSVALRCIWLFEKMIAFEDTRLYLFGNIYLLLACLITLSDDAKWEGLYTFMTRKARFYGVVKGYGPQLLRAPEPIDS